MNLRRGLPVAVGIERPDLLEMDSRSLTWPTYSNNGIQLTDAIIPVLAGSIRQSSHENIKVVTTPSSRLTPLILSDFLDHAPTRQKVPKLLPSSDDSSLGSASSSSSPSLPRQRQRKMLKSLAYYDISDWRKSQPPAPLHIPETSPNFSTPSSSVVHTSSLQTPETTRHTHHQHILADQSCSRPANTYSYCQRRSDSVSHVSETPFSTPTSLASRDPSSRTPEATHSAQHHRNLTHDWSPSSRSSNCTHVSETPPCTPTSLATSRDTLTQTPEATSHYYAQRQRISADRTPSSHYSDCTHISETPPSSRHSDSHRRRRYDSQTVDHLSDSPFSTPTKVTWHSRPSQTLETTRHALYPHVTIDHGSDSPVDQVTLRHTGNLSQCRYELKVVLLLAQTQTVPYRFYLACPPILTPTCQSIHLQRLMLKHWMRLRHK
jgi:hypothetical protein